MQARSASLRAIALFEAAKGLIVLAAGSGLFLLVGKDVQGIAEGLVEHLHLDPASRYPRIFLRLASGATPTHLRLIALGALIYAVLRFAEAVGLWHERAWAEWLGVITAGIYLPFEVVGFVRNPTLGHVGAIVANLLIIVFLAAQLRRRRLQLDPAAPSGAEL